MKKTKVVEKRTCASCGKPATHICTGCNLFVCKECASTPCHRTGMVTARRLE